MISKIFNNIWGYPHILLKNMIYNNQNYIIGFVSKMFDFFTVIIFKYLYLQLTIINIDVIMFLSNKLYNVRRDFVVKADVLKSLMSQQDSKVYMAYSFDLRFER